MIKGETGEHSKEPKEKEEVKEKEKERGRNGEKCFWMAVRPYKAEEVRSDRRRHNT